MLKLLKKLMKIKKSDNIMVLIGKDKGKTGIVEKVFVSENKVVVAGIAVYKKSVKPSKKAPKGGIIEINAKIPASNVAIICPSCSKATRVGYDASKSKKIEFVENAKPV